jgi:hypothetical protein
MKGNIDFVEMEQRAEEQIARVELERMRAVRRSAVAEPGPDKCASNRSEKHDVAVAIKEADK